MDTTLFIKARVKDFLIEQIYVDDIIFGATNESLCKKFSLLMQDEFEMSMIGKLSFFLGLQVKQMKDEIFINRTKFVNDLIKKFGLKNSKKLSTTMSTSTMFDKDEKGKVVDTKLSKV